MDMHTIAQLFFGCIHNDGRVGLEMPRQKIVAGISTPFIPKARKCLSSRVGTFFVPTRLVVDCAGIPSGMPGSFGTGSANPVQSAAQLLSTSKRQVSNLYQRSLS